MLFLIADSEAPVFADCNSYEVDETDIPKLLNITLPTVTDNSGLEPTISIIPRDFKSPYLVSEVRCSMKPLGNQADSNILKILPLKYENFQIKILIFFIFLLKI